VEMSQANRSSPDLTATVTGDATRSVLFMTPKLCGRRPLRLPSDDCPTKAGDADILNLLRRLSGAVHLRLVLREQGLHLLFDLLGVD
jgi:hypothetical protein